MHRTYDRCSESHRDQALAELRAELAEFNHDGLTQLIEDLCSGAVVRGSWTGCVISYKRGAAGSSRRDRIGRARNAFTILWDSGWLTDEEVADIAHAELRQRDSKNLLVGRAPIEHARKPSAVDHAGSIC